MIRLWRPTPSFRSLSRLNCPKYSSATRPNPLRILFCGSDEFSISSLRALYNAKQHGLIESLEVVHRPGKRTGRGLKIVREVPIKRIATELKLPTYEIDTFTKWVPPNPFDLIIAVSFGLLVPPRILQQAKYGGLNVHPSLLPDLRGPAPIHHALLKGRVRTGISVQTLHPTRFDHGTILAQTPAPGVEISPGATVESLTSELAQLGSDMLLQVVRNGLFVPPHDAAGWYSESGGPIDHAEKITKEHRCVDFMTMTAEEILTRHRVLGDLWCIFTEKQEQQLPGTLLHRRIVLNSIGPVGLEELQNQFAAIIFAKNGDLIARCKNGSAVRIVSCTLDGGKKGLGQQFIGHALREQA